MLFDAESKISYRQTHVCVVSPVSIEDHSTGVRDLLNQYVEKQRFIRITITSVVHFK